MITTRLKNQMLARAVRDFKDEAHKFREMVWWCFILSLLSILFFGMAIR